MLCGRLYKREILEERVTLRCRVTVCASEHACNVLSVGECATIKKPCWLNVKLCIILNHSAQLRSVKNHVQITRWLLYDLSCDEFFSVRFCSYKPSNSSLVKNASKDHAWNFCFVKPSHDYTCFWFFFVIYHGSRTAISIKIHFVIVVRSWNNSTLRFTWCGWEAMSRVSRRKLSQNPFFFCYNIYRVSYWSSMAEHFS